MLLNELQKHLPNLEFGLFRDDGLAIHKALSNREIENTKKKLHEVFKKNGLRITIETSCTKVDFLDVTLDLTNDSFQPYKKQNSKPLYVHSKSNHPKSVIRQIPLSVNKRLENISSDKKTFDYAKGEYQKALCDSGYKHQLKYSNNETRDNDETTVKCIHNDNDNNDDISNEVDTDETDLKKISVDEDNDIDSEETLVKGVYKEKQNNDDNKKRRKRDIIWFNPPYNSEVSTNIGRKFLELIDHHFFKEP